MRDDIRARAYRAAATITRERLRRDAPERARALESVQAGDVVVVAGAYDHVESVLGALDVPHSVIQPGDLDRLRLRPEQLLIVNCPGQVSDAAVVRIRRFVEAGGSLFTTDWALRYVIEPAFPGVLACCAFRRKRSASPGFSIASPRRPRQRLTRSVIYPLRITSLSVSFG
ncbi:MAG: hypothetical protein QM323_07790 [Acidobacteriota bacterium]|nr:hypothetical protein [Acidobacteriota bacterium]